MLLEELGVSTDERILWAAPPEQLRAVVPYNRAGARSRRLRSVLDLSPGQEVRLNPAHNCQGGSGDRASVPTLANAPLSRLPPALPAPRLLPGHCAGVPGGVPTPGPGQGHSQGEPPAARYRSECRVLCPPCTVLYCTVLYCTLLQGYLPALFAWELEIEGVTLLLGGWWLETAARGEVRL